MEAKCLKGYDHSEELVTWVCLNEECRDDLLACNLCFFNQHKDHQVIPLKLLKKKLPKQIEPKLQMIKSFANTAEKLSELQDKIEQNQSQINKDIETTIQNSIELKQQVQKFFVQFKEEVKCQMPSADIITNALLSFPDTFNDNQALTKSLQTLIPYSDVMKTSDQEDCEQSQFKPEIFCENAQQLLDSHKEEFKEATEQVNHVIEEIDNSASKAIIISSSNLFGNLKFMKLNENDIQYDKKMTWGKKINSSVYKVCLLNQELKPTMKVSYKFKIIDPSSWLGVGAFYKKKAETASYNFSYSSSQHGGYLISSNGGSWSSSDSTLNNTIKAFNFYANDIITVDFNGPKKTIKFTSKTQKKDYTLKLNYIKDDHLYPCVVFYYTNGTAEIINKDQ